MSAKTKIEWCDATWNPVQGCDPISPGCKNCYATTVNELEKFTYVHHIPFFFKKWGNGQDNRSLPREFPVFRKTADARAQNEADGKEDVL